MPASRIEVLFLAEDEDALETALRLVYPDVLFIDQRYWQDPSTPPARQSIRDCGDVTAIWVPSLAPDLRGSPGANGRIDGPQVGPVVQWIRDGPHALDPDLFVVSTSVVLSASTLAAATVPTDDPGLIGLQRTVWRTVKKLTSNRLRGAGSLRRHPTDGGPVRTIYAGHHALAAARTGKITLAHGLLRLIPEPDPD